MSTAWHRVAQRGRFWAGFRCREPVVVLESDDWGLRRRPDPALVARWGTPSEWAEEHDETVEDLTRLTEVLTAHVGADGGPAALTMNVIAANPDHEAIEADGFARYHDRPVDETWADGVRRALDQGLAAGVFHLGVHGRSHFAVDPWLADLRADRPGARELFAAGVDGGLSLLREEGWRYHSELVGPPGSAARSVDELVEWLAPAVATVARVGGGAPRAAVAPHYVVDGAAEAAWSRLGIAFLQACERRLDPGGSARTSYLGQPGTAGLVHLTRTVRFDPRPQRPGHHVDEAAARLLRCFAQGLPAVVDTHRINYTGPWADDGAAELDRLLAVADEAGARYLTTAELGEAVTGAGRYRRRSTGEPASLTTCGALPRAVSRPLLGRTRS